MHRGRGSNMVTAHPKVDCLPHAPRLSSRCRISPRIKRKNREGVGSPPSPRRIRSSSPPFPTVTFCWSSYAARRAIPKSDNGATSNTNRSGKAERGGTESGARRSRPPRRRERETPMSVLSLPGGACARARNQRHRRACARAEWRVGEGTVWSDEIRRAS